MQQPPSTSSDRVSRRSVLAAAAAGSTAALAGCGALDGDDPAGFHDGDWLGYGNGPHNRNAVAGGAPAVDDRTLLASADWPFAPPVVVDDTAYFATGRRVHAVAVDGTEQWTTDLTADAEAESDADADQRRLVSGAPAVDPDRGRLYVPTRVVQRSDDPDPAHASVAALELADGAVTGFERVGDERTYGVTVHGGDVYARSATACVRLAPDGTERWRTSLEPLAYDEYNLDDDFATQTAPAVENAGVYVPDRGALVKLEPGTGDELWRVDANAPYAASVLDDGGVVQTGWQGTVAVDRHGDVRWRRDLQSLAAAAAADGDVYVAANDLHELDGATGETNWQTHLSSEGTAAPVVTDDAVVVDEDHPVAFRRDAGGLLAPDRERWSFSQTHTGTSASPVVAAGRLFAVGSAGLYAFHPADDA